jgi:membrane-associated protein
VRQLINFFLHIDKHLEHLLATYGKETYIIFFAIIFIETGIVIMPFLPGDSLLFAVGALAANPAMNLDITILDISLFLAAVLGDTLNYAIGSYIGPKVFTTQSRWLKKEYLLRTQTFYEKHGGKTILLARFLPIIRTFAPFIAGVGKMKYSRFLAFNVVGGLVWVELFLLTGYFFGTNSFVKENFSVIVLAIIFVSVIPPIVSFIISYFKKKKDTIPS